MKHTFLVVLLQLCGWTAGLMACSCSGPATFCQTLTPRLYAETAVVFRSQVLDVYTVADENGWQRPVMDVVVSQSIVGDAVAEGDTLSLIGQDGVNCAALLTDFTVGEAYLINLLAALNEPQDNFIHRFAELVECGRVYLAVRDDTVFGPVAPGVDSLPVGEFLTSPDFCLAGPPPEGCSCTLVERDLCDDAATLYQNDAEPRVIRVRPLQAVAWGFDENGFELFYRAVEITELLLGSDFAVGDTVIVRDRYEFGCAVPLRYGQDDLLWLYSEVAAQDVTIYTLGNAYPLLLEDPCLQRLAVITNDSVRTLAGPVAYPEYLVDLAECVPSLAVVNLAADVGLRAFPNPVTELLTVRWQSGAVRTIDLIDARGRTVYRRVPDRYARTAVVPADTLTPGIYYLRLTTDGGTATQKIVVR